MRISDWSSDVCSSDLRRVDAAFSVHPPVRPSVAHEPLQIFIVRRQDDRRLPLVAVAQESLAIALHGAIEIIEIGVLAIAGGIDARRLAVGVAADDMRSEEHTSELQSLMRISSAVICLNKKTSTLAISTL